MAKHRGYKMERAAAFQRDNYTCQRCFLTKDDGVELTAHHIFPIHSHGHLKRNVDNLVTLCRECHDAIERDIQLERNRLIKQGQHLSAQKVFRDRDFFLFEYQRMMAETLGLEL